MGKFKGLPVKTLFSGMNKALAFQLASTISKEDFLIQLEDTWLILFSSTTGSIDEELELTKMRDRVKKSGYQKAFDHAGITDEDLVSSFKKAVSRSGRSLKNGK